MADKAKRLDKVLLRTALLFVATLSSVVVPTHPAAADVEGDSAVRQLCAQRWFPIKEKYSSDPVAFESHWRSMEPQCKGTGIFEFRLASLLALNGKRQEAIALLDGALSANVPLHDELEAMRAGYVFDEAILQRPKSEEKINVAVRTLEQLAAKFPASQMALLYVSLAHAYQHRYADVLDESRRLIQLNGGLWEAHRNLVLGLVYTNELAEADSEIAKVLSLHPDSSKDPEFMLAVATLHAKRGELTKARDTLSTLKQQLPGVNNDPEFLARARELGLRP